jgi:acyl-CoA thioester hydrolase
MMGAFIDLNTRKLTSLPEEILKKFENLSRTDNFKVITKEDTRKYGVKPIDL